MRVGWFGATVPVDNAGTTLRMSGDTYTLSGDLQAGVEISSGSFRPYTTEELHILRSQIIGLGDTRDDDVVSVVLGGLDDSSSSLAIGLGDGNLNGFYRIKSATCDYVSGSIAGGGSLPFSITMERVERVPLFESTVVATNATNPWGKTPEFIWGGPNGVRELSFETSSVKNLWVTATKAIPRYSVTDLPPLSRAQTWSMDKPDLLPIGGCYLAKVDLAGVAHPYGGRIADSSAWEIGNGLVRIRPSSGTFGSLEFQWRASTGSAWTSAKLIRFGLGATATWPNSIFAVTVVKNSITEVAVRLATSVGIRRFVTSISLRRGLITARVTCESSYAEKHWGQITGVTSTAASTGLIKGPGGNEVVLGYHQASTTDLATSTVNSSSGIYISAWGVSMVQADSGPDPHPTLSEIEDELWCWASESWRATAR